jgi:hypothetical protein
MFIVLDVVKFLREGHELFLSDNGIVMAYEEVGPEYWHTVVMGRYNNPVNVMPRLAGLHGREEAWRHYLVNECNWLKYYLETGCDNDLPDLAYDSPPSLAPSRVRTRDRQCRTYMNPQDHKTMVSRALGHCSRTCEELQHRT